MDATKSLLLAHDCDASSAVWCSSTPSLHPGARAWQHRFIPTDWVRVSYASALGGPTHASLKGARRWWGEASSSGGRAHPGILVVMNNDSRGTVAIALPTPTCAQPTRPASGLWVAAARVVVGRRASRGLTTHAPGCGS
jgi:hypothetical protein